MIENLTKPEREVLEYFVSSPEKIHLRGLSEEVDLAYSTVRKSLQSLENQGFLESDEQSKMTFYSPTGERFRKAKKIINLEKIENSEIAEYIDQELRPESVVLFGSYLEGRDDQKSDIDIAIVGGREKSLDLERFEEELGRKIQLVQVEDAATEEPEFRNTLANGYMLQGYLEVAR